MINAASDVRAERVGHYLVFWRHEYPPNTSTPAYRLAHSFTYFKHLIQICTYNIQSKVTAEQDCEEEWKGDDLFDRCQWSEQNLSIFRLYLLKPSVFFARLYNEHKSSKKGLIHINALISSNIVEYMQKLTI